MAPDYSSIDKLFTQEVIDQFKKRVHEFNPSMHEKLRELDIKNTMSFSVPTNTDHDLLNEINSKLDQIISHIGVSSAYIFTGKDVIDEFKKLNWVK
jgi:uncharacterized protein YaaR (DUF327 family)